MGKENVAVVAALREGRRPTKIEMADTRKVELNRECCTLGNYLDCGMEGYECTREEEGYVGSGLATSPKTVPKDSRPTYKRNTSSLTGLAVRVGNHESGSYRDGHPAPQYAKGYATPSDPEEVHTYRVISRDGHPAQNSLDIVLHSSTDDQSSISSSEARIGQGHLLEAVYILLLGFYVPSDMLEIATQLGLRIPNHETPRLPSILQEGCGQTDRACATSWPPRERIPPGHSFGASLQQRIHNAIGSRGTAHIPRSFTVRTSREQFARLLFPNCC